MVPEKTDDEERPGREIHQECQEAPRKFLCHQAKTRMGTGKLENWSRENKFLFLSPLNSSHTLLLQMTLDLRAFTINRYMVPLPGMLWDPWRVRSL
ncbi:uncharacterized protein LOC117073293 isoform X2 [Trachypithecus francoisi]|uniref:uncharacterized protein LOC117073293 isoform X2 n=1 Tax=Trachypithecus francoisi TaxID=54180 RepID=UPI00141B705F|nr:uncharacterized protein LOC117073293 isoform X2 [Trachypithecus francoisi]